MELGDFYVGMVFRCGEKLWRCTDIGSRVIVAIWMNPVYDETWFRGPPYALAEEVFDEFDFPVCTEVTDEAGA